MNTDPENIISEPVHSGPADSEATPAESAEAESRSHVRRSTKPRASKRLSSGKKQRRILVIDVGGTHVKVLVSGEKEPRKVDSGPKMSAAKMAQQVKHLVKDWKYDAVTIGYPGPVVHGKPLREPHNLGAGWVKFDYRKAFGRPVRILNDAAMQALGSYKKGRVLFLGLGTGLGSAMIVDGFLQPMELAHLPYKKSTYEDYVGIRGLERLGKKKWRREVANVVNLLRDGLEADQVVLGGGNALRIKELPPKTILGNNANAFLGGFRVWEDKGITLIG